MKKLVSLVLALTMLAGMTAALAEEKVELVFCNWGDGTEQKMFE